MLGCGTDAAVTVPVTRRDEETGRARGVCTGYAEDRAAMSADATDGGQAVRAPRLTSSLPVSAAARLRTRTFKFGTAALA